MKKTIVLYPSAGIGHLVSMVELGKTILQRNFNFPFSITILIPPYIDPLNPTSSSSSSSTTLPYIQSVSSSFPSISFLHLPPISLPSNILSSSSSRPPPLPFIFSHLSNPNVLTSLLSLSSQSTEILALIFDFFCYPVLQLTSQLHIHSYCFCTSSASSLAVLLHLPTLQRNHLPHQTHLHFPGNPPIPISDMPFSIFDLSHGFYSEFLACGEALRRATGIMVNSFDSLEPRAVEVLRGGACVPDGATPPIYCVGPLVAEEKGGGGGAECLAWLDSQPRRSVVFLCFGSLGRFSAAQLREMAAGLERSGQRFLWVVRSPPSEDSSRRDSREPDLEALLPEGFLERTKGKGMVVKSWAPQVAVLSHDSVGGFVTHCGWNSVLEAVVAGVPMVAWPLYAEQRMNKPVLVEELKLAMAVEEEERGWVTAEEVERRVRGLMESEEGEVMKIRMAETKERAVAAMKDGGSSKTQLTQLAEMWMRG